MENYILMRRLGMTNLLPLCYTMKFSCQLPPSCNDEDANHHPLIKDYIIGERVGFGLLIELWGFHKVKVDRRRVWCLCVALTYFHVSMHPLHDNKDTVIAKRIVTEHKSTQKTNTNIAKWCLGTIPLGIGQVFSSSDNSLSSKQIWSIKFA